MNHANTPAPALAKLLALDDAVSQLRERDADLAAQIEDCRARLNGRIVDVRDDHAQLRERFGQLLADQKATKVHLREAEILLTSCKNWIERLPALTKLEPVSFSVSKGADLAKVRASLKAKRDDLGKLRDAPTPSADLRQLVESYISKLGTPTVCGIGANEKLRIIWPGCKQNLQGPDEKTADPLALFAILFKDRMVDAIMAEATRMANEPVPLAERPARIAALEREIEELSRAEEALVEAAIARGDPVHRSGSAPPVAVLGVRVVERARAA